MSSTIILVNFPAEVGDACISPARSLTGICYQCLADVCARSNRELDYPSRGRRAHDCSSRARFLHAHMYMHAAAELITYVSVSSHSQMKGEGRGAYSQRRNATTPSHSFTRSLRSLVSRQHTFQHVNRKPAIMRADIRGLPRLESASDLCIKTHKESSAIYLDRIAEDQIGRFLHTAAFVMLVFGVGLFAVCFEIPSVALSDGTKSLSWIIL